MKVQSSGDWILHRRKIQKVAVEKSAHLHKYENLMLSFQLPFGY